MHTHFIHMLNEQITTQEDKTQCKINVHFEIRGALNSYCIRLSKKIGEITNTAIDLSETSFQIPHLTLAMGYIVTHENYKRICEALLHFAEGLSPFDITFTKPFLLAPENKFVFIGTKQTDELVAIKKRLNLLIGDLIIPLGWDVASAYPHVTISFISTDAMLVDNLLRLEKEPPSCKVSSIGLSFSGPMGSCLGTIRSFEFST